jgi:hypothetical protein
MDSHHCSLCHKNLIYSPPPSSNLNDFSFSSASPISPKSPEAKELYGSGCDNDNNSKEKQAFNRFMAKGAEIENDDSIVYFYCGHLFHKSCLYDYVINHPHFFSKLHALHQKQIIEEAANLTNTSFNYDEKERRNSQSSRGSYSNSIGSGIGGKTPFWLKICPICDSDKSSSKQSTYPQTAKRKTKKIPYVGDPFLPLSIPYNNSSEKSQGLPSPTSSTSSALSLDEKVQKQNRGKLGFLPNRLMKGKSNATSSMNSSKPPLTININSRPPSLPPKNHNKMVINTNEKEQQITSLDQFELLTNSVPKYEILSEIEYHQNKGKQNSKWSEGEMNPSVKFKMRHKTLPPTPKPDNINQTGEEEQEGAFFGDDSSNLVQSPTKTSFMASGSSMSPSKMSKAKSTPIFFSNTSNILSNLTKSKGTLSNSHLNNLSASPQHSRLTDPNYVFSLLDTNKKNDTYKLKLAPPEAPPNTSFLLPSSNASRTHSILTSPASKISPISVTSPISAVLSSSPTNDTSSITNSDNNTYHPQGEQPISPTKKNKGKEPMP